MFSRNGISESFDRYVCVCKRFNFSQICYFYVPTFLARTHSRVHALLISPPCKSIILRHAHARMHRPASRLTSAMPDSDVAAEQEETLFTRTLSARFRDSFCAHFDVLPTRERSHKGEITRTALVKISYSRASLYFLLWIWILLRTTYTLQPPSLSPSGQYYGNSSSATFGSRPVGAAYTCFEFYRSRTARPYWIFFCRIIDMWIMRIVFQFV